MDKFLNLILNIPVALAQTSGTSGNGNIAASAAAATGNQVQGLIESIFSSIPYWITGFIVIVLSLFLSRIVKSMVENRLTEAGIEEEHKEIQIVASRTSSAAVLLIGITAGLKIAGLDLTSIIAALAFGVGFAMQDIIMNFVSGIIVLLQKQFTINDWVKVKGTMGIIKEIQSRYTVIKKFDGTKVIVPNSELFKNQVISYTSYPERRFYLTIGVDLYMDLTEVINQLYASVDKCRWILKHPKPNVIVRQPGPYYNKIMLRCWVESRKGIMRPISSLMRQIHKDFYRKGWSLPYPTDKIVFDKDVPPDVKQKAENYIEKHKKAVAKQPGLIQQQQQALQQQENAKPEQPVPQAQQIGVGGAQMETPVWLQQAAGQNQPEQQPATQPESQPAQSQQPAQPAAPQAQRPQFVIENMGVEPEVKTFGKEQNQQQQQANQESQEPETSMPIVSAPPVDTNPQETPSNVAMPLPDVEPNMQPNSNEPLPQQAPMAPVGTPDIQPQVGPQSAPQQAAMNEPQAQQNPQQ